MVAIKSNEMRLNGYLCWRCVDFSSVENVKINFEEVLQWLRRETET